jgi:hypothetical protein
VQPHRQGAGKKIKKEMPQRTVAGGGKGAPRATCGEQLAVSEINLVNFFASWYD